MERFNCAWVTSPMLINIINRGFKKWLKIICRFLLRLSTHLPDLAKNLYPFPGYKLYQKMELHSLIFSKSIGGNDQFMLRCKSGLNSNTRQIIRWEFETLPL